MAQSRPWWLSRSVIGSRFGREAAVGWPGRVLVGGFVLAHDLGADPAALGDRQARFPGPGPDGRAIDASACGQLRRAPTAATADLPASRPRLLCRIDCRLRSVRATTAAIAPYRRIFAAPAAPCVFARRIQIMLFCAPPFSWLEY